MCGARDLELEYIIFHCGSHLHCGAQVARTGICGADHIISYRIISYEYRRIWPTSDGDSGQSFIAAHLFGTTLFPDSCCLKTSSFVSLRKGSAPKCLCLIAITLHIPRVKHSGGVKRYQEYIRLFHNHEYS